MVGRAVVTNYLQKRVPGSTHFSAVVSQIIGGPPRG